MWRLTVVANSKGFSLLNTLVGAAVTGVIIMAAIMFFQQSAKMQKNLQVVQAFNDLVSITQISLDDVRACTYNFGEVPPSLGGLTLPPVGSEMDIDIRAYDPNNPTRPRLQAPFVTKAQDGQDLDRGLTITATKLRTVSQLKPGQYIARVFMSGRKTGETIGSPEISQSFPLYIVADGSRKILFCYGNQPANGLITLQLKQCEILRGPDYFWNPQTNLCENRYDRVCFPGDRFTATCPNNTVGLQSEDPCEVSGVSDPLEDQRVNPRRYLSGQIRYGSYPSAHSCSRVNASTVRCDYAQDVNSTGARCSACCNVEKPEAIAVSPN